VSKNVLKSLDVLLWDVENSPIHLLVTPHAPDGISDCRREELAEDVPDEGNRVESAGEVNLDCDELLFAGQEAAVF